MISSNQRSPSNSSIFQPERIFARLEDVFFQLEYLTCRLEGKVWQLEDVSCQLEDDFCELSKPLLRLSAGNLPW